MVGEALAAEAAAERGCLTARPGPEPRGASRDEEHGDAALQRAEVEEIAEEAAAALEGDVEPEEHLTEPLLDSADARPGGRDGEDEQGGKYRQGLTALLGKAAGTDVRRPLRALGELVAAACQVGGLGGDARQLDGSVVRRARPLAAAQSMHRSARVAWKA